ncbi:hypothetical protein HZY88_04700 [Aerococcaceae bacterium DSM 111176]|nr:hypothetical protein [Aerococcaceae bacterium DSM 111176]
MSKDTLALEWLSKHLGQPLTLDDVGYESYVFEGEELDTSLIPNECSSYFKPDQSVLTYLYAYGDTMVYFFQPLALEVSDVILVGLLDNFQLIDYTIMKGDV